ncbi:MAG: tripartite tricarboxylate transporter substrate binding protein [Burkholderiales bacterium]|nr:tripartite tricarboxylate transporter substrate binding protein [Burkholderiales bacterium]
MKFIGAILSLALAAFSAGPAFSQAYPNKAVKVIVPYGAGQGTDVAMRVVTEQLARELSQTVIIDNKPGAAGNLGVLAALQAPADGYTILLGTNATHAANKFLYPNLAFDPETDFLPIALTGMLPLVVCVAADSPYNDLQQLLAAARAKPDSINVGLPHTSARVVFELLKQEAKAPLFGLAYKGLPLADLVSGRIQVTIDTVAATRAHITAGKLKALAVTSATPSPLLPGVKSVAQQGVPGFDIMPWSALYAPKGTPPEIVAVLARATQKVMALPETRNRMMQLGLDPRTMGPDELREFMKLEKAKWGQVIRSAQITAD